MLYSNADRQLQLLITPKAWAYLSTLVLPPKHILRVALTSGKMPNVPLDKFQQTVFKHVLHSGLASLAMEQLALSDSFMISSAKAARTLLARNLVRSPFIERLKLTQKQLQVLLVPRLIPVFASILTPHSPMVLRCATLGNLDALVHYGLCRYDEAAGILRELVDYPFRGHPGLMSREMILTARKLARYVPVPEEDNRWYWPVFATRAEQQRLLALAGNDRIAVEVEVLRTSDAVYDYSKRVTAPLPEYMRHWIV